MSISYLPLIFFVQRRNVGAIVRYVNRKNINVKTPSEITRFIEISARSHISKKETLDYEKCRSLIDDMCSRINEFTVIEIRTIAHSIANLYQHNCPKNWYNAIANYVFKRTRVAPIYVLVPLVNRTEEVKLYLPFPTTSERFMEWKMRRLLRHIPSVYSILRFICYSAGLVRMGFRDEEFYTNMMRVILDRKGEANSIDLATVSQTVLLIKNMNLLDDGLLRTVMDNISSMVTTNPNIKREMSATNAVLILYSFAKMDIFDLKLFQTIMEIIDQLEHGDFEPHLIPLVLHSFATFKLRDLKLLENVFKYALNTVHEMKHENVANCIHSLAKLQIKHETFIQILVDRVTELLSDINVRELSNIVWSLSMLSYEDGSFIEKCLDRVLEYDNIDPMSCVQLLRAIKHYGINRKDVIEKIMLHFDSNKNVPMHIAKQMKRLVCAKE